MINLAITVQNALLCQSHKMVQWCFVHPCLPVTMQPPWGSDDSASLYHFVFLNSKEHNFWRLLNHSRKKYLVAEPHLSNERSIFSMTSSEEPTHVNSIPSIVINMPWFVEYAWLKTRFISKDSVYRWKSPVKLNRSTATDHFASTECWSMVISAQQASLLYQGPSFYAL